jgi:hypothetical protein
MRVAAAECGNARPGASLIERLGAKPALFETNALLERATALSA